MIEHSATGERMQLSYRLAQVWMLSVTEKAFVVLWRCMSAWMAGWL
jgi:hypothetical protein